jgi:large subunit ribosomal protein L22
MAVQVMARARNVRISPRKARQVINLIRGKGITEAGNILKLTPKKASITIQKVLKSAVANAEHNHELDADELVIKKAYVDEGPMMKRMRARARGRAAMIKRRSSHITIVVGEKEG